MGVDRAQSANAYSSVRASWVVRRARWQANPKGVEIALSKNITYRAEPVGSLLRPNYLKEARSAHHASEIGPADMKRLEDQAVAEAIALQEQAGLDVVTDGEMRRAHFTSPLSQTLQGIELVDDADGAGFLWKSDSDEDGEYQATPAVATKKLKRGRSIVQEEFVFARSRTRLPVKVTLPSPLVLNNLWSAKHSSDAYPDSFMMFEDMAEILREEVRELVALGCQYIQIDAPELTHFADDSLRADYVERGIDPERMLTDGVEIINTVASVPGARYAIHLCRGNRKGKWVAEGGYEAISRELFRRATNFDCFFLEYDDERSGGFEPLEDVPEDKSVVLGLVSTKQPNLESADEILARIRDASQHFSHERLGLSTQCGFSSAGPDAEVVTAADQGRKLALIGQVAHVAWQDAN